jgi:hypothetical protein
MARNVVVVSRHHPDLYVYLRAKFAEDADMAVILDRRLAERRREQAPTDTERRRRDRRSRPEIDVQLRARSHVIVTLP